MLAVSIPASELEMSAEDEADYTRFKKLLDRVGKPVVISSEGEVSEIIRRRLFEWYGVPKEAKQTIAEYADWVVDPVRGRDTVTLQTCTFPDLLNRLIVRADRV